VVVTVDEQRLRDGVGTAALSTGDDVSAAEARRIACNAGILPIVLGGGSAVLDLGRTARLFDKTQRVALAARDGGCAFPGCDRPPARTEAHHVTPWACGGKTDVANGALLCGFHHRLVRRVAPPDRRRRDPRGRPAGPDRHPAQTHPTSTASTTTPPRSRLTHHGSTGRQTTPRAR
jgi:hypothetical protein